MRAAAGAVALAVLFVLAGCAAPVGEPDLGSNAPPDPESDVLGWEGGYWHNETLAVTVDDGLNDTERTAVVRRGMARVEYLRGIEFDEEVEVTVISRETYREQVRDGGDGDGGDDGPTLQEVAYEAMFLVGDQGDAGEAERQTQAENVLGFYSPGADEIAVIAPSETPTIAETTLGHELVHAAQFRTFDPRFNESTTDLFNARRGLIEGDASYVDARYGDRCGAEWSCVTPDEGDSGDGDGDGGDSGVHRGIALLNFFPYSDGAAFVASALDRGGWERVNSLYDDPPATAKQVALPETYGEGPAADVSVADRSTAAWERVRFGADLNHEELGVAGLTAMLAYPSYHDGDRTPPRLQGLLNVAPDGNPDDEDPINYTTRPVDGWDGDGLVAYANGDRTGYVWQTEWESPGEVREFATSYRELLDYWGAEKVRDGVYRIPDGEFADAYRLSVSGTTMTVTNAPTVGALDGVRS
jgi:hypothetical protein